MYAGPPLPLPPHLPLRQLWGHAQTSEWLGAWMRGSIHEFRFHKTSDNHRGSILVSSDLGFLLGRCSRIALREQTELVVLETELLIQWRALQVVTGSPYLPGLERLNSVFPGAHPNPAGFQVPIPTQSPEEVLAECVAHGIQVAGSRIIYRIPTDPTKIKSTRCP
jgi:hypothetical protein